MAEPCERLEIVRPAAEGERRHEEIQRIERMVSRLDNPADATVDRVQQFDTGPEDSRGEGGLLEEGEWSEDAARAGMHLLGRQPPRGIVEDLERIDDAPLGGGLTQRHRVGVHGRREDEAAEGRERDRGPGRGRRSAEREPAHAALRSMDHHATP